MNFELHPNLEKKIFLIDLPLCRVLLEDNLYYPWIFLVPRRVGVTKMMDLTKDDQLQLLEEMDLAQNIMTDLFNPAQLNVAAIGNKTPQLHVHVIARQLTDPAWPATVWDHPTKEAYSEGNRWMMIESIRKAFENKPLVQFQV